MVIKETVVIVLFQAIDCMEIITMGTHMVQCVVKSFNHHELRTDYTFQHPLVVRTNEWKDIQECPHL